MEMLWKTHHLLDISVWDIVWNVFFWIFLGYGKQILQRIYIFQHVFGPFFLAIPPEVCWTMLSMHVFFSASFTETSTMIRLANPRSYTGFHCWSKPETIRKCWAKDLQLLQTMLYMIWTCCFLEKTWMGSPMTCVLVEFDRISLAGYRQTNGTTHSTLAITGTGRERNASPTYIFGRAKLVQRKGDVIWKTTIWLFSIAMV